MTDSNSSLYKVIRQLPWGHIKLLINKIKDTGEILFYITQTLENGWSRDILVLQIKSDLQKRQGKAITNFKKLFLLLNLILLSRLLKFPIHLTF